MSPGEFWERYWWIAVIIIAILLTVAAVYFGGCSVTLESGEVHGWHREVVEEHATPTPTPAALNNSR